MVCTTNKPESDQDFLTSPIWYNPLISKERLYILQWYDNGIQTVGDFIQDDEDNSTN